MTAVEGLKRAFESEFSKAVRALVHESNGHAEKQQRFSQLRKVADTIDYYCCRLPFHEAAPILLSMGQALTDSGAPEVAKNVCFDRVLLGTLDGSEEHISIGVQAMLGKAACIATRAIARHPTLGSIHALQDCLEGLAIVQRAIEAVVVYPGLYWLLYNCTVQIWRIARPLVEQGFGKEAKQYVLLAALVLESNLIFSTQSYLPWRVQLYREACYSMEDSTPIPQIRQFLDRAISKFEELNSLQKLDPIGPPKPVAQARKTAIDQLVVLKLRYVDGESAPQGEPITSDTSTSGYLERAQGLVEAMGRTPDGPDKRKISEALMTVVKPTVQKFLEVAKEVSDIPKEDAGAVKRKGSTVSDTAVLAGNS